MEQDCVVGLYQSLGLSVGAEFSSEDVSRLYRKVFHVASSTDEACMAMKKIAGGNNNWSCVGENVLDVLLEIEKERVKKEKLYWDLQLLNVGNLNSPYAMDKSVIIDPHVLNFLHQSTDAPTFKKSYDSDREPSHSDLQMWTSVGGNELHGSVRVVRRLRKAARHCWIRLASEGLQGIMPSPWQGQSLKVKGQAWGCVSLSDVLLLLDVKYDVMTHLLYTEMLQEHHTQSIWESWLPWQQHKEEGELEDLAEEALESGDMLHLAELPGAFRIYRFSLGASFKNSPESREKSWSAASLLYELHQSRQRERNSLTVLGDGLDRESRRLLCLYIRLATLRAQREKLSYSALLAARQSWETWPHVSRLHRAEQAALWLHGEKEEEQINDLISLSPQQQALLQLLVLTQEQERKHLVKLVHGVSLEDLQGPGCTESPKEENHRQAVLRNGCIKRLKEIHTSLQIQNDSQTNICSKTVMWSQHQLEHCSLLLLTHLLELQDVQASILLSTMLDKSSQHLQVLQDEYESQLRSQSNTNLLQLLLSDALLTSGSMIILDPNLMENRSNKQKNDKSSSTGPTENQNTGVGSSEVAAVSDVNVVQAADAADRQDVCTGCGAVMEEMPYLEILCASDATSKTQQSLSVEGRAHEEEEEGSATQSPDSYEKQGSLITLAWSKPPEDDADYDTAATDGGSGKSQDSQSSLKDKHQPGDMSSMAQYAKCGETSRETHDEDLKPTLFQSDSTGHNDAQSAEKPRSTEEQERTAVDNSKKEEAETMQAVHPDVFIYPTDIKSHSDDICSGLTNETAEFSRDGVEVEICPTTTESQLWDLREPEPTHTDDQKPKHVLAEREATRESTLMERERTREPVSAMEREKTMRNLVDMQRKVEQKQQRDRERQLLRVQERLSIIQNRKAEEDLLGLKHTERLKHLIQDLPQEDKNQQKTVVKERLEQLRRERSYVMQSKRDRNTAGFKELLGPVALQSRETEDGAD